ncbi:MAG: hypothetical protein DCF16_17620 [Alphaproteobacteria bacterium]|nr:MAG: hypothetical protein DCF16_17620 [Alphaproteobacteria bacterium]
MRARRHASEIAANDEALDVMPAPAELEQAPPETPHTRRLTLNEIAPDVANDRLAAAEEDEAPPFDPPDEDDILGLTEEFEDEFIEADAPFDAPDDVEESFGVAPVAPPRDLPVIELITPIETPALKPPPRSQARAETPLTPTPERKVDLPTPPISVLASWDRSESGDMLTAFVEDKRLARADIDIERGGLDGALAALDGGARPDLVIVDTTLSGAEMMQGVDRLLTRLGAGAKLIVIGAVNDIGVLRALNQRGVAAYMMAPVTANDLAQSVCALFEHADRSRVIAVMGARGGVGASTVAQNIAWTIAERCDAPTALVDLDIGFGAAAASFQVEPHGFVTDLVGAEADEATLDRALAQPLDRLLLAASPAKPELGLALDAGAVESMLARVRRTSAFVVLDLPHAWTAWVKQALLSADEVVLVAGPDLASLRNTDNLVKLLRETRGGRGEPTLALSMVGVPKRPEISLKDFAESVGVLPAVTFAFDPEVYGAADMNRRLLCVDAPKSKHAQAIEALACALSGREIVEQKRERRRARPEPALPAEAPLTLELTEKVEEAPESANVEIAERIVEAVTAAPIETPAFEPFAPVETPKPETIAADDHLSERERAYVEKARRRALGEVEARRIAQGRRQRRGSSRTLLRFTGVIAAAYALGLVTVWASREQDANVASVAPTPAASVAMETPADPFAALQRDYANALTLLANDDPQGVAMLRRTAEAGFPLAQYRLAKLYESGDGVAQDIVSARQWTERAAGAGNVRAMHDLGFYFARGEAVALDEAAAFRWFRQAAEFGHSDSQYNLGVLYQQGRGVSADMAEALFWFTLAANQGDAAAQERVAQLGAELSIVHLEQARARAEGFSPRTPNAMANGEALPAAIGD